MTSPVLASVQRTRRGLPISWTTVDAEGVTTRQGRQWRGLSQVSAAWGDSVVRGQAFARKAGRAWVALLTVEDNSAAAAIGWATAAPTGDPRTDGHGIAWESLSGPGAPEVITPGKKVVLDSAGRVIRPTQYLVCIVQDAAGAYTLLSGLDAPLSNPASFGSNDPIGIPAYPSARLFWAEFLATATPLYPYASFYNNGDGATGYVPGQVWDDPRVVDLPAPFATADGLATASDRCTRADSAVSLGTSTGGQAWTVNVGTWGVSSNQIYHAGTTGSFKHAVMPALADGIFRGRVKVPTTWAGSGMGWGFLIRGLDVGNFVRVWNNTGSLIAIQSWIAGGFDATIAQTAFTWVAGQTYDIVILTKGNKYRVFIDGVDVFSSWQTDSNSRLLTATGFGPYCLPDAQPYTARWDDLAAFPHTVTLPAAILNRGAVPRLAVGTTTLVSDLFTDTNGVRLGAHAPVTGSLPTEHAGTWTVSSNRAVCAAGGAAHAVNLVSWETGVVDHEVSADIGMPATLSARGGGETGAVVAGVAVRVVDASTYIAARLLRSTSQIGNDEIELHAVSGGGNVDDSSAIVHKINVKTAWNVGGTYRLRVQAKGQWVFVFAGIDTSDDEPLMAWMIPSTATALMSATRAGLYDNVDSDRCTFDTLLVRAL